MKKRFKRLGAILPQQEMQQNRKTVHPLRKQGERQVVVTLTHPNM